MNKGELEIQELEGVSGGKKTIYRFYDVTSKKLVGTVTKDGKKIKVKGYIPDKYKGKIYG